jgi:hypothetical protein
MSDMYRTMAEEPVKPSEYVRINKTTEIRRDLIKSVKPDGEILRTDGWIEWGDPERLREEGLLP